MVTLSLCILLKLFGYIAIWRTYLRVSHSHNRLLPPTLPPFALLKVATTNLAGVPVVVLSSSGYKPLIPTLRKLLAAPGANPSLVLVVAVEWSEVSAIVPTGWAALVCCVYICAW